MNQAPTSVEGRLTVGRWTNTYLLPAGHPSPENLSDRLDRCVSHQLPEFWGNLLDPLLSAADDSVWRIRELHLDFWVDPAFHSDDAIATTWAAQAALQLRAILREGSRSDSILHFENPTAYLVQFVLDLAAGRAWGKWYYDEFDSLRSLTTSRAIAEALLREPDQALPVILRLDRAQRLEEILQALTDIDTGKVYEACFATAASAISSDEDRWVGRILELWNEKPLCPSAESWSRPRNVLRLLGRSIARFPDSAGSPALKRALDGLIELHCVLAALSPSTALDHIVASLAKQDLSGAVEAAWRAGASNPGPGLEFFLRIVAGDAHWGMQAAAVILSDKFQGISAATGTVSQGETLLTPCGGAFLLGSSLLELDVHGIAVAATEQCEERDRAASLFRHLLAMKCLGRGRASDSGRDAALRLLSGLQGMDPLANVDELDASPPNLDRTQSMLVRNLAIEDRCDGRCLLAEPVTPSHSPAEVLLIRDLLNNQWVYLAGSSGDGETEDVIRKGVTLISEATGSQPAILLLGGRFGALEDSAALVSQAGRVVAVDSIETFSWEGLATELCAKPGQLARAARPASQDLAYFSLAGLRQELEMDAGLDLTWTLVARAALRHLARRLYGFDSSSPQYLYENFLSGVSTVRMTTGRIEVQLPAGPLAIILRMSGVWDQTYTLPWLPGTEICLRPPVE